MNLLVGMPVCERAWILPDWFAALESQGVDYEVVCVLSPSQDDTERILKEHEVTILWDERPGRPMQEIDLHAWGKPDQYEYMASMRNRLVETAIDRGADYFFSLDSDIILPPDGLKRLLRFASSHPGVVAPAVNMTTNNRALNVMQWVGGDLANRTQRHPPTGQADVVMAAMLLDQQGMQCRWQSHSQGEDVGFSLDAASKQVPLWWVSDLKCEHWMHRY